MRTVFLGFLLVILLLVCATAHADAIYREGSAWVRLSLGACNNPKVAAVVEARGEHPDGFRAASAHSAGREFAACWRPAAGGAYVLYEDGDQGLLPLADLKPTPEA